MKFFKQISSKQLNKTSRKFPDTKMAVTINIFTRVCGYIENISGAKANT
jgi:hypothetical protein